MTPLAYRDLKLTPQAPILRSATLSATLASPTTQVDFKLPKERLIEIINVSAHVRTGTAGQAIGAGILHAAIGDPTTTDQFVLVTSANDVAFNTGIPALALNWEGSLIVSELDMLTVFWRQLNPLAIPPGSLLVASMLWMDLGDRAGTNYSVIGSLA